MSVRSVSLSRGIGHAVLACAALGAGMLVALLLWGFAIRDDAFLSPSVLYSFAILALFAMSFVAGTFSGLSAARAVRGRRDGALAGAIGGLAGYLIIALLTILALSLIAQTLADQSTVTKPDASTYLRALVFALPAAVSGAIAGLAKPHVASVAGPAFAPTILSSAAMPVGSVASPMAAPPPPVSYPVASPARPPVNARPAAAITVQCPRCSTRIQAPAYRPAELACPSCGFRGTLSA